MKCSVYPHREPDIKDRAVVAEPSNGIIRAAGADGTGSRFRRGGVVLGVFAIIAGRNGDEYTLLDECGNGGVVTTRSALASLAGTSHCLEVTTFFFVSQIL